MRPRPAVLARAAAVSACLAVAEAGAAAPPPPEDRVAEVTKGELQDLVRELASDAMQGREAGTEGCDRAAEFVAAEFARIGLAPVGDGGTYFQEFTIPKGMKVLPAASLSGTDAAGKRIAFDLGDEFAPADGSAAGDVTAEAVFAGYGIRADDLGYDDYDGVDARGKVVVVLRHAPAWQDRKSPFATPEAQRRYAALQAKREAAAGAGAAALVIVNDPASSTTKDKDDLRPAGASAPGAIPVAQVAWRAKAKLLDLLGTSLVRRQQQIDAKGRPASEALAGVRIRVNCALEPEVRRVRNVVGLLAPPVATPASGGGAAAAAPAETVVVGAHYDHIGLGSFGSLGAAGKVHNGADDNASGTAAVVEIAGWLAPRRDALRRRVLFVAFTGEELGLHGSKHYVDHPLVPLADTVAMVNLDMVGRLHKNRLWVGGTGTSPAWPALLERLNRDSGKFQLTSWPGGKAPSDHDSFYGRGLPVLFFFTGLENDYHRPSDDWNTLDYEGTARVARLAAQVVLEAAAMPVRPAFTQCDAGGFEVGPYVGIAVEPRPDGLHVVHVDEKSPARKAGFRVGDRLVEWNGREIADASAWNDALSASKPGEKVDVVVSREGRRVTLRVTPGGT